MDQESRLTQLAAKFIELREEKFKRQGELKAIEEILDQTEMEMNDLLGPLEISKFEFRGKLLYQKVNSFPKVNPGKEDEFFEWLDKHNEGGIAKRGIHHKTLRTWFQQNLNGDKKAPPMHPEWAEELANYLATYEEININVQGDEQEKQRAQAYEEIKARIG